MNPKVDKFLSRAKTWQKEMEQLRTICLDCGLIEALKWGKPCYTFKKSNIAIIQPFKESCALMFFKGILLNDLNGILEKPGKHSQVARRISFTDVQEIVEMKPALKAYIYEAVEMEKAGLEVPKKEKYKLDFPEEFQKKLDENPDLNAAFKALTPGRQRAYNLYFSGAKQSKTRTSRVEKCIPQILSGKGLRE